jgi:hypothetical protein
MALKRKHVMFSEALADVVKQLELKWEMDFSSAVRHCVVLVAEKEGISARSPSQPGRKRQKPHQDS